MENEVWALAPISDCFIDAPCTQNTGAIWWCGGCMGNGRRVVTSHVIEVMVLIGHDGRPMAYETREDGEQ